MTKFRALTASFLVFLLALGGIALVASPAQATCGDTAAEWVDPTLGSAWSGTVNGQNLTVVHTNVSNASVTVVNGLTGTGLGSWGKIYGFIWSADALLWSYRFEVNAISCSGGQVTSAGGGAQDALGNIHSVSLTRTL